MLKTILIAENALEPETWKRFDEENILDFLIKYFGKWPENARLYNKEVSQETDVTPSNEKEIEAIENMDGPFYVIVYPSADPFTWAAIIIAVIAVAVVVFMPKPAIPNIAVRSGSEAPSSNNELANRTNKQRINGRIPDIFGQVRSVPDLIALPYKFFENSIEKEHSYLCIGKGNYTIHEIMEDTSPISDFNSTVQVYGPNTSPNSGDAPILAIGKVIDIPIKLVTRYTSVNGEVLDYNTSSYIYHGISFTHDSKIVASSGIDFTTIFTVGSTIVINDAVVYAEPPPGEDPEFPRYFREELYNFNGNYLITAVSALQITVSNAADNWSWASFIASGLDSEEIYSQINKDSADSVGPFYINRDDNQEVWCNFVAPNGIYKDNGTTKTALSVTISLRLTPVDNFNNVIGATEYFNSTLTWNGSKNMYVGQTLKAVPTFTGKCRVECKRTTAYSVISGYQVYEEVKWRDLYGVSPISSTHFGNVTTVQVLTTADSGSLALKERKLNILVTRNIPKRISGESFTTELFPVKKADDIISFVCKDKFIGNRSNSEIDFDNIYNTISAIVTYFGTEKAAEFSYTFDNSNMSFEETLSSIANSIFSLAYRRGNKIKLSFEKENNNSTILFNHRNKIPGTETRTINFGNSNDNDGIEYKYIDKIDDSLVSIYIPSDKSAINPNVVESIGVRNYSQAYFQAKRLYNKIKYRNQSVEFEATQESNICVINDRILVSDGTRSEKLEGEVIEQNLLELTLSQNLTLQDGISYTIFLQYKDGSVESIPITKTSIANKIILARAPLMSLVLDPSCYARTTFLITSNTDTRKTAFILTEKSPKGLMTSDLKAINYDARYYQNDKDLINAIISDS